MIAIIDGIAYLAYLQESKPGDMIIRGHPRTDMFVDTPHPGKQEWVVVKTSGRVSKPVELEIDEFLDIEGNIHHLFPFDDIEPRELPF